MLALTTKDLEKQAKKDRFVNVHIENKNAYQLRNIIYDDDP